MRMGLCGLRPDYHGEREAALADHLEAVELRAIEDCERALANHPWAYLTARSTSPEIDSECEAGWEHRDRVRFDVIAPPGTFAAFEDIGEGGGADPVIEIAPMDEIRDCDDPTLYWLEWREEVSR